MRATVVVGNPKLGSRTRAAGIALAEAVIAGLVLTQIQSISSLFISPVWGEPLVFGIMVLFLMVRPQGLAGRLGHG